MNEGVKPLSGSFSVIWPPLALFQRPDFASSHAENCQRLRFAPTNGLAFARLAKQVLAQSGKDNPRREGEADFFSRYALKWSPNDAEVAKIRVEIEEQIKNLPKP